MSKQSTPKALAQHDHEDCVDAAIRTAERLCRERGLRFTALRRRVLEIVWHSHKPVGAYDILASLGKFIPAHAVLEEKANQWLQEPATAVDDLFFAHVRGRCSSYLCKIRTYI